VYLWHVLVFSLIIVVMHETPKEGEKKIQLSKFSVWEDPVGPFQCRL